MPENLLINMQPSKVKLGSLSLQRFLLQLEMCNLLKPMLGIGNEQIAVLIAEGLQADSQLFSREC